MNKDESHLEERADKIRKETEALVRRALSPETRDHLVKAGSELALAFDAIFPHSRFPPEAKQHMKAMRREFLLMMRSIIDKKLESFEEQSSKELEKIDLD